MTLRKTYLELNNNNITKAIFSDSLTQITKTDLKKIIDYKSVINNIIQTSNNDSYHFLVLTNYSNHEHCGTIILYGYYKKDTSDSAKIYLTNYLDWINLVTTAKEVTYDNFTFLSKNYNHTDLFISSSAVYAFKVLYPLFISPKTYPYLLHSGSMLDIGKVFFKNKTPNRISDYAVNVSYTVNSEINKIVNSRHSNWQSMLHASEFNCSDICGTFIPRTHLKNSIVLPANKDILLSNLLLDLIK